MGQVLELPQLLSELAKRKPARIVFTNGCFDILHVGHSRYLRDARALGDLLVVGINSDASVKKLKGPERPIQDENDRGELLSHLASVDYVVVFDEPTPLKLIEAIKPDFLCKGGDWSVEQIVGGTFVKAHGGQVKSLPFHPGRSTTSLLARMDQR